MPWLSVSKQIWIRDFKWGTIKLSMTIFSKVAGHQILRSIIIRIAWSLSANIAKLLWGPGSIPGLGELWRLVTLQSFKVQGSIVPDLIHICLEPEDQVPRGTCIKNPAGQRGTMGFCRSIGVKVTSCQSWRFEKNSGMRPTSNHTSAARVWFPDDRIILQLLQLVILQPADLQRPTIRLWKELNLFNKHSCN